MTLHSPISSIYCSPLSAGLRSAAASTLSPSVSPLSTSTRSWICFLHTNAHISPVAAETKRRPRTVYIPHLIRSSGPSFPGWFLWFDFHYHYYYYFSNRAAAQTPAFEIGLGEMNCSHWGEGTNRQWLQMEFGQWSETLFTNWSLKFQRGESVTSGLGDPLTFSPRGKSLGDWL